jgi:hypothetical protein
MSEDTETVTVADVSGGAGGDGDADPGTTVSLPAVEILTGRGFVTGKSGSGKSNTASVIIEKLLSKNFPVLIVDTDGEYYGLKEEFEILHVGADDECDIQVSPEHAEKIASLALEQNVPIILDVSGYLDEDDANELLLETTRNLFAKEKKLKKPFLMLIEECHEYIPEGGGLDETGKMLIKVGKRGRKHGLGIVGISQRPADVKKDFITQCDWLVWHRLTWNNDTKVVGRILGSEYAEAIEDMDDGEAFLVTDWSESIRRVQFHRKQTFDAGATPGLEDFERPELKSVSNDLVGELRDISDERERRESELADLRQELEKKEQKIAQLERELEEARDMRRMADQFAQALLGRAEAPYRGGEGRNLSRPEEGQAALDEYDRGADDAPAEGEAAPDTATADGGTAADDGTVASGAAAPADGAARDSGTDVEKDSDDDEVDPVPPAYPGFEEATSPSGAGSTQADADGSESDEAVGEAESTEEGASRPADDVADASPATADGTRSTDDGSKSIDEGSQSRDNGEQSAFGGTTAPVGDSLEPDADLFDAPSGEVTRRAVVDTLTALVDRLDGVSRGMLAYYREQGAADPVEAHAAAGGNRDRNLAYGRNRPLRRAGFVRHAGRGRYAYAIDDLVREEFADRLDEDELAATVSAVESALAGAPADDGRTDDRWEWVRE